MPLYNTFSPSLHSIAFYFFPSYSLSPQKVSALFCPSLLSLCLSSNSVSRDKGTDSQALSRLWRKIGIFKLWSEAVPPPAPPLPPLPPPPPLLLLLFWEIFIQIPGFLILVALVNKPAASFSHSQILLKQDMFLRNCMSFTSLSSPNPSLSLLKPHPISRPSLPFPPSLHHPKPKHSSRIRSISNNCLSSLKPVLGPARGPKEGSFFSLNFYLNR